jgi:AraC family transcriptional regulator, transcriptional activator of pobA
MLKGKKEKNASLITPNDMAKFTMQPHGWTETLPLLHDKFLIHRIENYRKHMKLPLAPHRKPVFDFIFLTQGTSTRSKGMDSYAVEPNTFFFLPSFQILTGESMSEDVHGFYCHFDMGIFSRKFSQKDLIAEFPFLEHTGNPVVKIPEKLTPSVLNILERLEFETGGKNGWDLICCYLMALFLELKPFVQTEENGKADAAAILTKKYKDALSLYIFEKNKVSEYAQLLTVSVGYLNKCVKTTTGRTPHDLLDDVVLLEAKVLLKQMDLQINEIAYKIGKQDPSDFGRFFKHKTGMTPKEYKNQ